MKTIILSLRKKVLSVFMLILIAGVANAKITITDLTVNTPACAGTEVTIGYTSTGDPGTSWRWYVDGDYKTDTPTFTHTFPLSTTTKTYQVKLIVSAGLELDIMEKTITIYPLPTVAIQPDDISVCPGSTTSLIASGAYSYAWSTGATSPSITPTVSAATTYEVTGTDTHGCTDEASSTVGVYPVVTTQFSYNICQDESYDFYGQILTSAGVYNKTLVSKHGCDSIIELTLIVDPLPLADAGDNTSLCLGESVELLATGGTSYLWNNSISTASNPVSPETTTTYVVTVEDDNGCKATDDVVVTVHALPLANAGDNTSLCLGESVELLATGGTSYLWNNSINTASNPVSPETTTTYVVTATDDNGCKATDDVVVTVHALPTANAGDNTSLCLGESVGLLATGGTSYLWNNDINTASNPVSPETTIIYIVTATDDNGCKATDDVVVTVYALPLANAGDNTSLCLGESVELLATGGTSYLWNNSINTASNPVSPETTTTYVVTVEDDNGCKATNDVEVIVNALPLANAGDNTGLCLGESVGLLATGGTSYKWNNNISTASNPVSPETTTTYVVTVEDDNGCKATDDVTVNVYTPFTHTEEKSICEAEQYLWYGVIYTSAGNYNKIYTTVNGCDSIYYLNLTINNLPQQVTVQTVPQNKIITNNTSGEIKLTVTESNTNYWVTKSDGSLYSQTYAGTGSALSLGSNYEVGMYSVWSKNNTSECSRKQAVISFILSNGGSNPQLIGVPLYGNNMSSFDNGSVDITVYKSTTDINNNTVIIKEAGPTAISGAGRNTIFNDIAEAGNYYMKSQVIDLNKYSDVVPTYFYDGATVDSADIISLDEGDALEVTIVHPEYSVEQGSNLVSGSVVKLDKKKSSKADEPLANQVIIVRDKQAGEILTSVISDASGNFTISDLPNNKSIELFVTSFEYQKWTAAEVNTGENESYTVNFVADATTGSVYPEGTPLSIISSGIDNLDLSIYPNPASEYVNISGIPAGSTVKIFNTAGKLLLLDNRNTINSIDISSLPSASYIIVVESKAGGVGSLGFVKQ